METVRLLLALAARKGWEVHHLDVKTTFLYGELQEDFMRQPEGFEVKGKEHMVYKLKKALYGLKQATRAWNTKLHFTLLKLGFKQCKTKHAVCKRSGQNGDLVIGVYVDDIIVTGSSPEEIAYFKQQMKGEFETSDLGLLTYYIGLQVNQTEIGMSGRTHVGSQSKQVSNGSWS